MQKNVKSLLNKYIVRGEGVRHLSLSASIMLLPPGSETLRQFCHFPSRYGEGFNRPFVSSIPGRSSRRSEPSSAASSRRIGIVLREVMPKRIPFAINTKRTARTEFLGGKLHGKPVVLFLQSPERGGGVN